MDGDVTMPLLNLFRKRMSVSPARRFSYDVTRREGHWNVCRELSERKASWVCGSGSGDRSFDARREYSLVSGSGGIP